MTLSHLHALRTEYPSTLAEVAYRLAEGAPVETIPYPLDATASRLATAYASTLPDDGTPAAPAFLWRETPGLVMTPEQVGLALGVCWRADAAERRWRDRTEPCPDAAYERMRDGRGF